MSEIGESLRDRLGRLWDKLDEDGRYTDANTVELACGLLTALQTIALHAPSLDVAGIRGICDAAMRKEDISKP